MVRAIKRHYYFEISRYTGLHKCISIMMSQDHSGLDSILIANEIRDLVKGEMPHCENVLISLLQQLPAVTLPISRGPPSPFDFGVLLQKE